MFCGGTAAGLGSSCAVVPFAMSSTSVGLPVAYVIGNAVVVTTSVAETVGIVVGRKLGRDSSVDDEVAVEEFIVVIAVEFFDGTTVVAVVELSTTIPSSSSAVLPGLLIIELACSVRLVVFAVALMMEGENADAVPVGISMSSNCPLL